MNTEIKIFTINGYNASVGNDIRYQVMPNGRIYQILPTIGRSLNPDVMTSSSVSTTRRTGH